MTGARSFFVFFSLTLVSALVLASCGACSLAFGRPEEQGSYTFLVYNVRNLFDDKDDGTEYSEFDPGEGSWTTEDYRGKLDRIGKVLRDAEPGGPDFVALVEIENESVLKDLNDARLSDLGYAFAAAAVSAGAPAGTGFLSRLPVVEARSHIPLSAGFPQRPVLELLVNCDGDPLTVFICHFKSKSEGAEATEANRIEASRTVMKRVVEILLEDPGAEILILGDLNENADEFERAGRRYPTALMPADAEGGGSGAIFVSGDAAPQSRDESSREVFYSPWLDGPPHPGSYLYGDRWETIDHVLLSPGLLDTERLVYDTFKVLTLPYLLDSRGAPVRDYSDHLPIFLGLRREGE